MRKEREDYGAPHLLFRTLFLGSLKSTLSPFLQQKGLPLSADSAHRCSLDPSLTFQLKFLTSSSGCGMIRQSSVKEGCVMRLTLSLAAKMYLVALATLLAGPACAQQQEQTDENFILKPIGVVQKETGYDALVLKKDVQPGLLGLGRFSHVWVIWWFDRNDKPEQRSVLQVFPHGDKDKSKTGVFACRSPVRPNLVGLTLCRILSVEDNVVKVDKIDAYAGTPILDLKPYSRRYDSPRSSVRRLKD